MRATIDNYAGDAFAFVEAIARVDTAADLVHEMERALSRFGFEYFVISSIPRSAASARNGILIHQLPEQWYELYNRKNFLRHDPVFRHARRTVQPFLWSEAPHDGADADLSHEVMDLARGFRMEQGFCLPIHGIEGVDACISLSGRDVDVSARVRPALHLMALYAFEHGRRLSNARPEAVPLSPREIEVLELSARGLSVGAIAKKLGISERTVTAHVTNACEKLGAGNKTQAVAEAVHRRYIVLPA